MFARHVTVRGDLSRIDDAIRVQTTEVLPALHDCEGFVAQLVLVDRNNGDVIGMSIWDSDEHMRASEERIRPARQRVAEAMAASGVPDVRIFELAIFDRAGAG